MSAAPRTNERPAGTERSFRSHKAIGKCQLTERRGGPAGAGLWSLAGQRVQEIEDLIRHRHGAFMDTDDALLIGMIALNHIVMHERAIAGRAGSARSPVSDICRAWLGKWAPAADPAEIERAIALVVEKPRRFSAERLGQLLRVSAAERRRLKIRTIRPFDMTFEEIVEERRVTDKTRKAAERSAARAAQPRKATLTDLKPWEAFGWSRRTWYRKGRPMPVGTDGTKSVRHIREESSYIADAVCATGRVKPVRPKPPTRKAPRRKPEAAVLAYFTYQNSMTRPLGARLKSLMEPSRALAERLRDLSRPILKLRRIV
ncbi:hypothetical protein V5F38_12160 [Xanthobacter sp. V0B-10]|uniref:hypothetical protein n=1 Tax=Xanthobacter albus TaxID=3119929 RepID=UPI00372C246B